ncbi:hypothetical protein OE88DRAFT_1644536 [Heliocybe sulcata]|uniref:Uncharacterized protein n=1 Tax=Heliocybe sulcata TaxID=5364 RepID=A0A5C3N4J7_9AGAM|nr:hypothetical protein OE88DRAFT_1644536 [Heliocybe sulcata]
MNFMATPSSELETPTRKSTRKSVPNRRIGSPVELTVLTSMTAIPETELAPDSGGGTSASAAVQSSNTRTSARKVGNRRIVPKKKATRNKEGDGPKTGESSKASTAKNRESKNRSRVAASDHPDQGLPGTAEDAINITSDSEDETGLIGASSDMPSTKELIAQTLDVKRSAQAAVTPLKKKITIAGNKRRIPGSDDDVQVLPSPSNSQIIRPSSTQKPVIKRQKVVGKKESAGGPPSVKAAPKTERLEQSSPVRSDDLFDLDTEDDDGQEGDEAQDSEEGVADDGNRGNNSEEEEVDEEEGEQEFMEKSGGESDEEEEPDDDDRPRPIAPPKPAETDSDDDDRPKVLRRSVDNVEKGKGSNAKVDKGPAPNRNLFKQFEEAAMADTYEDLPALKYWVNAKPYRDFGGRSTGNVLFGHLKFHLKCHETYAPCKNRLPNSSRDPICPHVQKDLEFIKKSLCFQQKGLSVLNLSRISPDILHVTSRKDSAIAVLQEDTPVLCASVVAVTECYLHKPVERSGFSFKYLSGVFYTLEWQRWLSVVGTVYDQTEHVVARMDGDAVQFSTSSGGPANVGAPSTPSSRPPLFSPSKSVKPASSVGRDQANRTLDLNDKVPIYDGRLNVVDRALNWDKWIDRLDQVGLPEFTTEVPAGSTAMVGYTITRWKPTKPIQGTDPVLSLNLQWVVVITSPVVD